MIGEVSRGDDGQKRVGGMGGVELVYLLLYPREKAVQHRFHEGLLGGEVVVKGFLRDAEAFHHLVKGGRANPLPHEQRLGHL